MTSNRSEILDDIEATLATMASPTYNTTLKSVSRVFYSDDEFEGKCGPLPGVCFWPATKQPKPVNLPTLSIEKYLVVWICGYVRAVEADRSEAIAHLQDDIRRLLCNDTPTRGGWAVETIEWEPEETDEGIEDDGSGTGDIGAFQFAVRILYYPDD